MPSQLHKNFDASAVTQAINVKSYESLIELGAAKILAKNTTFTLPHADDCAIIMYTSGSTGKPKGSN